MLSLSAEASNTDVDLQIINGEDSAGDGGVLHGKELMAFAEAIARREESALLTTRQALIDAAGNDAMVDAAAVAGNFQRMVRIADSTGIPVDGMMGTLSAPISEALNLRRFGSAQNTPEWSAIKRLLNIPKRALATTLLKLTGSR